MIVELNTDHNTVIRQNIQKEGAVVLKDGSRISGKSLNNSDSWSDEALTSEDLARVSYENKPIYDELTQDVTENTGSLVNNIWIFGWDIVELSQDEIDLISKDNIIKAVDTLFITTTSGKVFDARPKDRQNMADAILASDYSGIVETTWRLYDNTEPIVTLAEIKEAHFLSLQAYATAKSIGV